MYHTRSSTDSEEECLLPQFAIISGLISIFIIMLLGSFGNLLVIIVLCKGTNRLLSNSHLFIISVAVSDLMTSVTVLPFDVVYWINFPVWSLGPKICRLWNGFFFAFLSASAIGVTEISMDIYLAVTRPLHYHTIMTKKRCRLIIILSWIWSATVGILIYFFQEEPPPNTYLFDLNSYAYGVYLFIHLVIPLVLVPIIYLNLFKISVYHASKIQCWQEFSTEEKAGVLTLRQQMKLAKTFGFVTVAFFVSWTPFLVVQLFYIFKLEEKVDWCKLEIADTIVCWFSYVQCCTNPMFYGIRHKYFRKMALHMLRIFHFEHNSQVRASSTLTITTSF